MIGMISVRIHVFQIYSDIATTRELLRKPVFCTNRRRGCDVTVPWGHLSEHLASCQQASVKDLNPGFYNMATRARAPPMNAVSTSRCVEQQTNSLMDTDSTVSDLQSIIKCLCEHIPQETYIMGFYLCREGNKIVLDISAGNINRAIRFIEHTFKTFHLSPLQLFDIVELQTNRDKSRAPINKQWNNQNQVQGTPKLLRTKAFNMHDVIGFDENAHTPTAPTQQSGESSIQAHQQLDSNVTDDTGDYDGHTAFLAQDQYGQRYVMDTASRVASWDDIQSSVLSKSRGHVVITGDDETAARKCTIKVGKRQYVIVNHVKAASIKLFQNVRLDLTDYSCAKFIVIRLDENMKHFLCHINVGNGNNIQYCIDDETDRTAQTLYTICDRGMLSTNYLAVIMKDGIGM